jgi:hypothetical protein
MLTVFAVVIGTPIGMLAGTYMAEYGKYAKLFMVVRFINDILLGASSIVGLSVALSGDGNTVVVREPGDNDGLGATWVFTRSGGVWTQQRNKLVGTGAVGNANQGLSVAKIDSIIR